MLTQFLDKDLKQKMKDIPTALSKLDSLVTLIENINGSISFMESLKYIYSEFSEYVPYSYIGIALIKDGKSTIEATYGISDGKVLGLPEGLAGLRVELDETSLGRIITTGEARIINSYDDYIKGRKVKEYTRIIMQSGIRSSVSIPLKVNNKPLGMIFFSSIMENVYTEEHLNFLKAVANSIAICFDKNIFVEKLLYSSILALAKLSEARDEDTGDHIERIKVYSRFLTAMLYRDSKYKDSITLEYIDEVERFSPMHDIGKVGVRDSILLKPGRLTAEEFEEMKKHTGYGAQVLKAAEDNMAESGRSLFLVGIEIAESHHEKWDGTGYPAGLSGEEIPLSARIVAVSDVFDALVSKRPYKQAFTFDYAYDLIAAESGKHFDPEIIRILKENKESWQELYMESKGISDIA